MNWHFRFQRSTKPNQAVTNLYQAPQMELKTLQEMAQLENPNIPYTKLPLRPTRRLKSEIRHLYFWKKISKMVFIVDAHWETAEDCKGIGIPAITNIELNNQHYQVFEHGPNYTYYLYSAHLDKREVCFSTRIFS